MAAPQGIANVARLGAALEDPESGLPDAVRELGGLLLDQIEVLTGRIKEPEAKILKRARESEEAKRLGTVSDVLQFAFARKRPWYVLRFSKPSLAKERTTP